MLRADPQPARSRADATQRFDGIHHQIDQHLLQLDAVAQEPRHLCSEVRLDPDPVALHFTARQREDVPDQAVEVEPVLEGGVRLARARIRPMMSPARWPSATTRKTDCWARARFCAASQRRQALALLTMAPSGWLISWAIEAVSSPNVVSRAIWASSAWVWRTASSACWRSA